MQKIKYPNIKGSTKDSKKSIEPRDLKGYIKDSIYHFLVKLWQQLFSFGCINNTI